MVATNKNIIQEYSLLEYRKNSKEIPYIKGIDYRVDQIYILPYMAWGLKPKQIAKEQEIPLEAIVQAITWCENHGELLNEVLEREGKEAGL